MAWPPLQPWERGRRAGLAAAVVGSQEVTSQQVHTPLLSSQPH